MYNWNQAKFLALPHEQKHKKASEILREISIGNEYLIDEYNKICQWLQMEPLTSKSPETLSNRFHYHLKEANVSWQEHNLLIVRKNDKQSNTPFLNIAIYLDNLRSAFNVGSILRTVEAFRLGQIYFSPSTPFIDNPKVQKTSMNTFDKVNCHKIDNLDGLPRPFIALETADFAPSITEFSFPDSFTLILGNEEYGLSETVLKQVDHFVQIPLVGSKNSLNVASAFAIAAATIRK
ncbi:MAG: RNA methyltransferase [Chlamydiae bacterium]|nr:RNA methyltransferase [Chlamydiota bacterium]